MSRFLEFSKKISGPPTLALDQCFAKTRKIQNSQCAPGRTVLEHCLIAGAVADALAARLNASCPGLLPKNVHVPSKLHDIGKISPGMQANIYENAFGKDKVREIPALSGADARGEALLGGHAAAGRACLIACGAPDSLADLVGSHHRGTLVSGEDLLLRGESEESQLFGGAGWAKLRREACALLLDGCGDWPHCSRSELEVILGLTVTADWIASGPIFDDPLEDWRPLVEKALDEAGFVWPRVKPDLSFREAFGWEPRSAQQAFFESVTGPGLYILEAPTGLGKTEAALYAAYRLLAQRRCSGIFFALPTRLSSARVSVRINDFLATVLEGEPCGAQLVHGGAWLDRRHRQRMGGEAEPGKTWSGMRRRGMLAPFGVGTIDQCLRSVMRVRYSALSTFGLAGKAVILDEVHSYDAYTGTILDTLVSQLLDIGCTVMLLSATLSRDRRAVFLPGESLCSDAYPLISALQPEVLFREISCEAEESARVSIDHPSDEQALEEAVSRAARGERVLWVENTVHEALDVFWRLKPMAGSFPLGLLHSRFTAGDRIRREKEWAKLFEPDAPGRGVRGCIVVGTQILEQSLDLDADFLITRICPTDMILQRMGRLWRHRRADAARPAGAERKLCLLHPAAEEALAEPESAFESTGLVYAPYVLARSLELWKGLKEMDFPGDVRGLLEATYADRREEAAMARARQRFFLRREKLRDRAFLTGKGAAGLEDEGQTRWHAGKEISLILYRHWDPKSRRLLLADGGSVRLNLPGSRGKGDDFPASWEKRRKIAARLGENTLTVPKTSERYGLPSWLAFWTQKDRAAVLLREDGSLVHADGRNLKAPASYHAECGYAVERKEKKNDGRAQV